MKKLTAEEKRDAEMAAATVGRWETHKCIDPRGVPYVRRVRIEVPLVERDIVLDENGELYWRNGPRPQRPRKPRKPSISRMVAAAEKIGKSVTSVSLPDGTVLHFGGEPVTEATNPWPLTDFTRVKQ